MRVRVRVRVRVKVRVRVRVRVRASAVTNLCHGSAAARGACAAFAAALASALGGRVHALVS